MPKATQQKRKQTKEKRDDKLCPEEEKVAKLYKAGKLKFKRFENVEDCLKDLNS
ncbi:hypothetical protein [Candidatus Nitrosotalea okcheonensis]|uniref:Uncharacterized protein n=1 Tax=Candidatus Nitrosotalea okcheonensis TaxID=1903276 RepID=A0A2H1FEU2_9ARCH|nr:hypothetical protein [Candidatus Nitrosotalea okcheonensis]SMH71292.1 protein of unknown function [Candidatus Nitrosotalea okcheonensis]